MIEIYLITNEKNGKYYVGQTARGFSRRWSAHKSESRAGKIDTRILRAIRKYGPDSFSHQILTSCEDTEKGYELERLWVISLDSTNPKVGYNLTFGGKGLSRSTDESKQKNKEARARTGFRHTEEAKDRIRVAMTGREVSKETRAKISKICKGRTYSDETLAKMSASAKNKKPMTEETKKKIGDASRGRIDSPETKAKKSASRVGIKYSEETIGKMREVRKQWWVEKRKQSLEG